MGPHSADTWLTNTLLEGCSSKWDGLWIITIKSSPQPQVPGAGLRSIPQTLQKKSNSGIATSWLYWWSSFWQTAAAAQSIRLGEKEGGKRKNENGLVKSFAKKKKIWLQLKHREGEERQADDGLAVPWWETNSNELRSKSSTKQGYEFITLHLCRVKRSSETPETCRGNWGSTNPHGIAFKIISQLADCTGGKNRD